MRITIHLHKFVVRIECIISVEHIVYFLISQKEAIDQPLLPGSGSAGSPNEISLSNAHCQEAIEPTKTSYFLLFIEESPRYSNLGVAVRCSATGGI